MGFEKPYYKMKMPTPFSIIRNISRNKIVRKVIPYRIQVLLWHLVKKNRSERLRREIVKYYRENALCADGAKSPVHFLKENKNGLFSFEFLKIWLKDDKELGKCFDFCGAKLPDISKDTARMNTLLQVFQDTFLFHCLLNDNYDKKLVKRFDAVMMEGPYGYTDEDFDVTVKENDVVIDVGAWIGDFSAYSASKGATVYAFEPIAENCRLLSKTAELNDNKIIPIQKGLGSANLNLEVNISEEDTSGSCMYLKKCTKKEKIKITTLDEFVEQEKLKKINFIKADIEGDERHLLRGAKGVLRDFAPKLAICTYHFPEDPKLLEKIILSANPNYRIIHTRQKLFAMVK